MPSDRFCCFCRSIILGGGNKYLPASFNFHIFSVSGQTLVARVHNSNALLQVNLTVVANLKE
ncbi:hypothetical protein GBA52_006006 [Prunus armeniaca]|nr:hypothetical protein GBA52_006006 [Prunus armeniaca]